MILEWLSSAEWANVVKALLHTLWHGAVVALLLGMLLRRWSNPVIRYRCALGALALVMLAGLVTWAVLNRPLQSPTATAAASPTPPVTVPVAGNHEPPLIVNFPATASRPDVLSWPAWLGLFWLLGATAMMIRAAWQVAGADRLRRSARPLADARIDGLMKEARRAVGLARQVRWAVTEQLTSPAVVGVLVPVLILPLSLTTTLSPEQIRFVLLHELAHIQRGDYLAGLFQLFAEAMLFFNPAVWWISRQVRIEREACCDALAIELSGAPADYARTLVHVAENVLNPAPAPAPAFGARREPSLLTDRVLRMLVPGYRPKLRLSWRAMLLALFVGGGLLFLSALGTRVTVAAILSPQERIERIEQKMAEYGESPTVANYSDDEPATKAKLSGIVRTADGSPVPTWVHIGIHSEVPQHSYCTSTYAKDGKFSASVPPGMIQLGAGADGFAPTYLGPLDGLSTNRLENLQIVLNRGFETSLQVVDADSGKPLPDARAATIYWIGGSGFQSQSWKTDGHGTITLNHAADLPLDVTVNAAGHEILTRHFDHVRPDKPFLISLLRGGTVAGTVLDQTTGEPISTAEFHLIYQIGGENTGHFEWDDALHSLGKSDGKGAFRLNQLRSGVRYYLGVAAPGHESVIVKNIVSGTSNLIVRLGPELIVRGRVIGTLDGLQQIDHNPTLDVNTSEVFEQNSYGHSQWATVRTVNGVAKFEFTNRVAGMVTLTSRDGFREERQITAPVDDWVVNLTEARQMEASHLLKREVVFRFTHPSSVTPVGTVEVSIPDSLDPDHLTAHMREMQITNGAVRVEIPVGGQTEIAPKHMVGYWFNHLAVGKDGMMFIPVPHGPGPLVVEVPLLPAGAIFAKARNADGSPAGGLLFGVSELKRAPGRGNSSLLDNGGDNFSGDAPRKWASGPLPLGGTYQVHAWRGNSFCISRPIRLTEASPDAEVELQFPPGKTFSGTLLGPDGTPLSDVEVKASFTLPDDHGFGLKSVFTDERGKFELENCTPEIGKYCVEVDAPGIMAERVALNFTAQPQITRLQPGRTLAGRVVDSATGYPIPGMEVRALDYDRNQLPMLTTHTDADGRFEFTSLGKVDYTLYPDGGELLPRPKSGNQKFRADGRTNLVLRVKLYSWSQLKPKEPADPVTATIGPDDSVLQKSGSLPAQLPVSIAGDSATNSSVDRLVQDAKPLHDVGKTNLSVSNSYTTNKLVYTGPGRQEIIRKLQTLRLDRVNFEAVPLGEVLRTLAAESKKLDPDHRGLNFLINPNSEPSAAPTIDPLTGLPMATSAEHDSGLLHIPIKIHPPLTNALLGDVLDAVVMVAPKPIQYSIQDYAIVFSERNYADKPALVFRTFRVGPNIFNTDLTKVLMLPASTPSALARNFFSTLGVNWDAPKGKLVFYNDRLGSLFVKATESDLNTIERALSVLNQVAPHINIKAQIVEVSKKDFDGIDFPPFVTNVGDWHTLGILTREKTGSILQNLRGRAGFQILAKPEATVTSGRQLQMRTSMNGKEDIVYDVVVARPMDPDLTFDIVPCLLSDGYTINLTVIPLVARPMSSGTPTNSTAGSKVGNTVQVPTITAGASAARQMVETMNLWDGQTMVLGKLRGEAKVVGANAGSETNTEAKEVLVFITATIVDPAGNRVHTDDEMPFARKGISPPPPQSK